MDGKVYDYTATLAVMEGKHALAGALLCVVAIIVIYVLIRFGAWGWHQLHLYWPKRFWPKHIPDIPDWGL